MTPTASAVGLVNGHLDINVELHPKQAEVFAALCDTKVRECVVRKGRRAGGTFSVGLAATKFAIENPTSPFAVGLPTEIGFFGPIYENAFKIWREITDRFGAALIDARESKLDLVWHGGARGKCYSGEKLGAVLGSGLDIAEVDEASNFPGDMIRSHIVPALTDRQGRLWIVSSPRHGSLNYFAQRAMKAEARTIPGVVGFHMSSYDNPRLSHEWLESQRLDPDMDEQTWREEWLADIINASSNWLDPSLIQYIASDKIPGNTFNVLTSDFAWGNPEAGMVDKNARRRKDANVLAVISQDAIGNIYVRREGLYEKLIEPDQAFEVATQLIRAYDIKKWSVEREVNVQSNTLDMFGRLWNIYRDKFNVQNVGMVRPHRRAHWKTPAIRMWSTLLTRRKFFVEEGSVLAAPLVEEMTKYSEAAAANDRCHDDVLVAMADVLLPGIFQGRLENETVRETVGGPDRYNLRAAWDAVGNVDDNARQAYRSKYSVV